jgi:hypothetical protein
MPPRNGSRSTLAESTSAPRASRDANHHPYPDPACLLDLEDQVHELQHRGERSFEGHVRHLSQGCFVAIGRARPEEHANADSQRDRDDYQPRPGLTGAMIATTRLGTKSASRPRSPARRRSRSPRPIRRPRCPISARACPPPVIEAALPRRRGGHDTLLRQAISPAKQDYLPMPPQPNVQAIMTHFVVSIGTVKRASRWPAWGRY